MAWAVSFELCPVEASKCLVCVVYCLLLFRYGVSESHEKLVYLAIGGLFNHWLLVVEGPKKAKGTGQKF